jgi:hypothetical protein
MEFMKESMKTSYLESIPQSKPAESVADMFYPRMQLILAGT